MGMREGWGVGPIGENSIIFCLTLLKEADYRISVCSNSSAPSYTVMHTVTCLPFRHGDHPAVQAVKPGLLLKAVVQAGLANYVYPCAHKAKKSVFRSGI